MEIKQGPNKELVDTKIPEGAVIRGCVGVQKAVESAVGDEHELVPDEILDQHDVSRSKSIRRYLTWEVWNLLQKGEIVAIVIDGRFGMFKKVVAHAATFDECHTKVHEFSNQWRQEKGSLAPRCSMLSLSNIGLASGYNVPPTIRGRGLGN